MTGNLNETLENPPESEHPPAEERPASLARAFGGGSLLHDILETILLTLIIFALLNVLTGRFQVRGSSMEPTLHNGQYLIVSKLAYWFHPPERGDIIVFHPPNSISDDYIKRIVGLPGEHVEIENGEIIVDNIPLEEPYIVNRTPYEGSWNLEADEYFVLGDNRGNSSDSHSWGALLEENITGKAWLSYWPPQEWGLVPHHTFQEPSSEDLRGG